MAENTENKNTQEPGTNTEDKKTTSPTIEELAASVKALQAALEKQKKATDNASSDAANWKKKFQATLSEAEKAEADRAEAERTLREENEPWKRDKVISSYSNRALSLGYDADLAAQTAEAMANGDMSAVFDSIDQLIQKVRTKTVTENYGKQANLSTGTPPSTNTVASDEDDKYRKWMGLPPRKK